MLVSRLALSVHGFLCVHEQFHFLVSNARIRNTNFPGNQKFLCNFWLQTSLQRAYCWLGSLTDTLSMSIYPVCFMYCVLHSYNTGSIRKITRKRTYTVMSCNICVGADLCSSDLHCSRSLEPWGIAYMYQRQKEVHCSTVSSCKIPEPLSVHQKRVCEWTWTSPHCGLSL